MPAGGGMCRKAFFEMKIQYVVFDSSQQADNKKWLKYKIGVTLFQVFDANF